MIVEQQPIALRYIDLTVPSGATVQLTLFPADTFEWWPDRLIVRFTEKSNETFTAYLGPGVIVRESVGLQYPVPLDENGQPRQFRSVEEYQAYLATRAPA